MATNKKDERSNRTEETSEPKESGSMLEDGDYSEAEKIKSEDYYGDKYNSKFVQELLSLRKDKEKEDKK